MIWDIFKMAKGRAPSATVDIKIRMKEPLRAEIEHRAAERGISMNGEMVDRLSRSIERQHLLDEFFDLTYRDPHLVALLLMMGETMRDTLTASKADDWINDPNAFAEVAIAAQQTIEAYRPLGEPAPNAGELAVPMVRSTLLKILEGSFGIAVAVRNRIGKASHRLRARQRWYGPGGWITPAPEEGKQ